MIANESRCLNSNHQRANPEIRYCPNCGEVVNEKIPAKKCREQVHTRRRLDVGTYCVDCGEQLIR